MREPRQQGRLLEVGPLLRLVPEERRTMVRNRPNRNIDRQLESRVAKEVRRGVQLRGETGDRVEEAEALGLVPWETCALM